MMPRLRGGAADLLLAEFMEEVGKLRLDLAGHGGVNGGDQRQHVRRRIAHHVPRQRPASPELLVPPVDVLHLQDEEEEEK